MLAASLLLLVIPGTQGIGSFTIAGADTTCVVMGMDVTGRASPLDSLTFTVGGHPVKLCYGRPSARGRTMIGGKDVPFGTLWRTGANEPTMIHTTAPITISGVALQPGSYSIYTLPGPDTWEIIVNASVTQWGHIARYSSEVEAQEVGRGTVASEPMDEHVETMRFRAEPDHGGATLLLEWERTRVRIPIGPAR